MKRLTICLLAVGLAACGSAGADLNPAFVQMVDARAGSCFDLQDAFDRADEVAELEYVDQALEQSGCYD